MGKIMRELEPVERLFRDSKSKCDFELDGTEFIVECRDRKTNKVVQRCHYSIEEIYIQREHKTTVGFPTVSAGADGMGRFKLVKQFCEDL